MNVGNEETAHDVYNACNGDDEVAMELTLDGSRLALNGYPEAQQEVYNLCQVHGYNPVLSALAAEIQLL
jgi:DNA-directed RNA polymerase specialized sigma24 family protein